MLNKEGIEIPSLFVGNPLSALVAMTGNWLKRLSFTKDSHTSGPRVLPIAPTRFR